MKQFLLDSNIYINFYDRYYREEYFPSFWTQLPKILNKYVIIPRIVVDENYHDPKFKKWLDNNFKKQFLNHKNYAEEWAEVLEHIKNSKCYKSEALTADGGWAHEKIADPWLIAIAKKDKLTIVTEEIRNPNLHNPYGNKAAKIPDVCDDLMVDCIDMNGFFKEINLSI